VDDLENPSKSWLVSAKKKSDLSDVDIVRRHLISKTIKDCSLMIVFVPKKDGKISFKMEIVDLDLKVKKLRFLSFLTFFSQRQSSSSTRRKKTLY